MADMNGMRLTLISDPTNEFPDNTNVDFKVRLSEPLILPGDGWETALVSLSTSNIHVGEESFDMAPDDILCNVKFQTVNTTTSNATEESVRIRASQVLSSDLHLNTGLQMWQRIAFLVTRFENDRIQRAMEQAPHDTYRCYEDMSVTLDVQEPENRVRLVGHSTQNRNTQFSLHVNFAKKCGFLTEDPLVGYRLGPNAFVRPILSDDRGRSYRESHATELDGPGFAGGYDDWQVVGDFMTFTQFKDWYFTGIDETFTGVTTAPARSLLVYSDLVQSSYMGNQKHPLLREIFLPQEIHERQLTEPLHYQWMPLRNNNVEVVHVEIGTLNGGLAMLPKGKTLVSVRIRRQRR